MKFKRFEEIIAWQKAKSLTVQIYRSSKTINDFGFKNQIQRACVSIMNNIAEGFERRSDKEFVYFLFVAKGSCGETRSMLILAKELEYLNEQEANELSELSQEVSRLISGLIRSLN